MIGQTIAHYEILERLGEGGMGVVYKARDTHLGRLVALKFLRGLMAVNPAARQRLEREARLAGSLNHPNICTIYEIGEHDGCRFIAMELLAGRSLLQVMAAGALDESTVVDVGIQLADALEAAHAQGIVHRDLKPENVFVNERGLVKVLDFGLVKRLPPEGEQRVEDREPGDGAPPSQATSLTGPGAFVGTVEYMSPEQVRAGRVDHRTDLFSLGTVLYQMTTGSLPFRGSSPALIAEGILNRSPVPPIRLNPSVSPQLEEILDKALEKDPELRYQHASDLRADLLRLRRVSSTVGSGTLDGARGRATSKRRWVVPLTAILVVAAALGLSLRSGRKERPAAPAPSASIAVLPFADLSPAGDQTYFADGLAEELLADLGKIPGLRVAGRTSSFRFRGDREDVRKIGQELNVATVLEGSVRRDGDRVRITAQLLDAVEGFHLWSETYDRELVDMLELQDEIATSVARTLQVRLLGEPAHEPTTTNPEAYNAYLQGQYFYQRQTRENLEKAVGYFRRAVELDPGSARAWTGLGAAFAYQAALGYVAPEDGYARAREAVHKAIELDPNLARARNVSGWIQMTYDWDWSGARASLERARALDPGRGLLESSLLELALGNFDEALELAHRAAAIDPLSPQTLYSSAAVAWYCGHLDEAIDTYRRILELFPEGAAAHGLAAQVHLARGNLEQALREIDQERDDYWRLPPLALARRAQGRQAEFEAAVEEYVSRFQEGGAYQVAQIYAAGGDADRAVEWLERAYDQRDGGLFLVAADPVMRGLSTDRRFRALLERMGLEAPPPGRI